eukprot:229138-Rhodomonas_salina.1
MCHSIGTKHIVAAYTRLNRNTGLPVYPGREFRIPGRGQVPGTRVLRTVPDLVTSAEIRAREAQISRYKIPEKTGLRELEFLDGLGPCAIPEAQGYYYYY